MFKVSLLDVRTAASPLQMYMMRQHRTNMSNGTTVPLSVAPGNERARTFNMHLTSFFKYSFFDSVSFGCDDLAVISSGFCSDIVCTSLDPSTTGTRLLNLQQQLPPIDIKAESCCPSIKNVSIMASFPRRSIFDSVSNTTGSVGAASRSLGASHEIQQGLVLVKERLQKVTSTFAHSLAQY